MSNTYDLSGRFAIVTGGARGIPAGHRRAVPRERRGGYTIRTASAPTYPGGRATEPPRPAWMGIARRGAAPVRRPYRLQRIPGFGRFVAAASRDVAAHRRIQPSKSGKVTHDEDRRVGRHFAGQGRAGMATRPSA